MSANKITSTLNALTKGEYWSNKQNFKEEFTKHFYNGAEILELVDMNNCNQFFFKGENAEMLIYNDRQIMFSCCYVEYYSNKIITIIYDKNGKVYDYEPDYDKLEEEFKKKKRR